ncbi:hypothetical protein Bache_1998 [Bacteroides helcogenes P 36-108]|uniref:Uncharacterized protein n=1 Tax=Bacteroides helcogenes (strain ATCC 35417 / DSM 20613 / JCM 6297 / CCUG 15421 / P 36-108) TaxID=693979 RepID=E6SQB6_BACT6|nr:hypothetical protein Bache_1998 [Bacteroides helcogenes P 36-108]
MSVALSSDNCITIVRQLLDEKKTDMGRLVLSKQRYKI